MLDTNAAIDWLVFDDPAMRPIVRALAEGRWRMASDAACMDELERTLGYPEFALDMSGRSDRLERYRLCAQSFPAVAGNSPPELPVCRDPDDQKFLELAARSGAALLVTRDRALLRLATRLDGRFQIVTPAELSRAHFPARVSGHC